MPLQQDLLQKAMRKNALAASFGATLLLHSEALKKTLFLQLVDQTFIEKLFYGSVCYRVLRKGPEGLREETAVWLFESRW